MKRCEIDVVLNLLSKGLTKDQIRKKLNLKPSALSNHLRRLEISGCIERKGKYVINILSSSHFTHRVTKNQVHNHLNKRGHAYNLRVVFPKEQNLLEKPKVKHELEVGNLEKLPFGSLKFIKDKCSVWINKGSLTIYSNNSYYSGNALHSKFAALKDVDKLVQDLKVRFGFSGMYGIEVFREHYGLIFNKFAKWLIKNGRKLYVKDRGNKTILWVDNSRKDDIGLEEFEGEDPLKINSADEFFNSHERTNWKVTPELTLKLFNNAAEGIKRNAEHLEFHAANMRTHIDAVQKLGKAVEVLSEKIDQFSSHTK